MSKCISSAGEFGSHELDESGPRRFVCRLCWALDEDQILATVTDAEARLARAESLAEAVNVEAQEAEAGYDEMTRTTPGKRKERAFLRTVSVQRKQFALRLRAALAPVEPATEEADRG